jgi:SAM-dependent methyltransferase
MKQSERLRCRQRRCVPGEATPMSDYYRRFADDYNRRTFGVDPAAFLQPLRELLPAGSRILDVGCGSGRDLVWLARRGFTMTGFERSEALAALAEARSGCPVIRGDFRRFDFSKLSVDGLLLVAALVHVPHGELAGVLSGILEALRPGGIVLLSLKKGDGMEEEEEEEEDGTGRRFYRWQPVRLDPILAQLGLVECRRTELPSVLGTADTWLTRYLRRGNA